MDPCINDPNDDLQLMGNDKAWAKNMSLLDMHIQIDRCNRPKGIDFVWKNTYDNNKNMNKNQTLSQTCSSEEEIDAWLKGKYLEIW